jgi:recombination protein RecA
LPRRPKTRATKEAERQRIIRTKLARLGTGPRAEVLPTGFTALDTVLGGGLPRGAMTEIFGPSSSGKTTLALQIAAHVDESGGRAAWVDAEHSLDPAYAASLGADLQRLPIIRPASAEQALEITGKLAASGALDVVIIDSAAALVPELELESGVGDASPGLQSRVLASGLQRLKTVLRRAGSAIVFLNQTRTRTDSGGTLQESSASGAPLKMHAAVRIALIPADSRSVRFRLLKNKSAQPFAEGSLVLGAARGFVKTP